MARIFAPRMSDNSLVKEQLGNTDTEKAIQKETGKQITDILTMQAAQAKQQAIRDAENATPNTDADIPPDASAGLNTDLADGLTDGSDATTNKTNYVLYIGIAAAGLGLMFLLFTKHKKPKV